MSSTFEARYGGTCEDCGERFKPGDLIRYEGDGDLIHADCTAATPAERPAVICQTCHLTQPCDCEATS